MTRDYVAELLRATEDLRSGSGDPAAVIERALAAAGLMGGTGLAAGSGPTAMPMPMPMPAMPNLGGRRPLGEVIAALRNGRSGLGLDLPGGLRAPTPQPPLPEGAAFNDLTHSTPHGSRRYRLYVPASAAEGVRGLVLMLHGCTQTPEDFAVGTGMNALAEAERLVIAYPAQTGGENSMSCWNWFRPGDQQRGGGEPAILADLATTLRDRHGVPQDRVFAAGLSAGAAMAIILAETYPEVFEAVGVHSGIAYGAASDVLTAFAAMRGEQTPALPRTIGGGPRRIVFHGTGDTTVHPSNARRIIGDEARLDRTRHEAAGRRGATRLVSVRADGRNDLECWMIDGAGHAWSGGDVGGSYTDPSGPDASAAMVRFFLEGRSDSGH